MPDLPPLTVPDVREWVGDRNLSKGQPYQRGGALRHLRRAGMVLRGECQGTAPAPYQVEIRLDAHGIASGACSCPVGAGGRCKHSAALLLAWLHRTEAFVEVADVDAALATLDRDQLAALVKQLYARVPTVSVWLDTELTRLTRAASPNAVSELAAQDALTVTSHVSRALDEARDADEQIEALPLAVTDALAAAKSTAAHSDHPRAATLYAAIMEGAIEALMQTQEDIENGPDSWDDYYEREHYYDEEGYLASTPRVRLPVLTLEEAAAGLGESLSHLSDPAQRAPLLDQLYDTLTLDVDDFVLEEATYPSTIGAILVERTTPDERRNLLTRFKGGRSGGEWGRTTLGVEHCDVILGLAHGLLDDGEYLQLCRDLRADGPLLDELLRLGRIDEAVAELGRVASPLNYEGTFSKYGQSDAFYDGIHHLPSAERDPQLAVWLRDRAEARGDLEDALTLARRAFDLSSTPLNYRALRTIATRLERWQPLREALFARERKARHWSTVTELYLEDQELDHALESLKQIADDRQDPLYSPVVALRLKVAGAAESTRPDAAIALYLAAVEHILTGRGRHYYARAAELLERVRTIYRARGEGATWQAVITRLREQYRRLTALQDELAKAKLFEREPAQREPQREPQRARPSAASSPGVGLNVAPDQLPSPEQAPHIHVIRAPDSPFGSHG